MLLEPWATLVFIGGGSILLQVGKLVAKKWGETVSTKVIHWGAGILTAAYLGLTGGFAGIPVPVVPTGGAFLDWLGFVGGVGALLVAGTAAIAGIYDIALRKIYGGIAAIKNAIFG
jgi:hypothetical protein